MLGAKNDSSVLHLGSRPELGQHKSTFCKIKLTLVQLRDCKMRMCGQLTSYANHIDGGTGLDKIVHYYSSSEAIKEFRNG